MPAPFGSRTPLLNSTLIGRDKSTPKGACGRRSVLLPWRSELFESMPANPRAALAYDEACIVTSEQRRGTTSGGWTTVETETAG